MRPIPGVPIEQQSEAILKIMLLWGEARGESPKGKLAVLWVVKNRAAHSGQSVSAEILRRWQFSSFNENDPNRGKLLTAWKDDPVQWAVCEAISVLDSGGDCTDPTSGARHYYAHKVVQPTWGIGHPGWKTHVVIDNHTFGVAA